ncbi:hypothetical protein BDV96DRAFT_518310 [Lophiotrema nucula]|uniref:Gfd2/YDR514C-like C-terminal domain-containing protein n=1 Tax=Lophiotrema nucula TaxID=690887 RepID=A0A6A5ZG51_9PLEO|nr:hypothetical protein BDV96DRAFT_518310 [Lophiotrema nucula]
MELYPEWLENGSNGQPRRFQGKDPTPKAPVGNPYKSNDPRLALLAHFLDRHTELEILRHFLGYPIEGAPKTINETLLIGLDTEWWEKDPKPTTEFGVGEFRTETLTGLIPGVHAENILTDIRVAHARIIPHAHLMNKFPGAGNPEDFHFGTTVFVTPDEARHALTNILARPSTESPNMLRPVIFIGHAIGSDFEQMEKTFGIDLLKLGSIVKVIDTQDLARQVDIYGPKGPNISLKDLLAHFNIMGSDINLHTAGNDVAYTMMLAILIALKKELYGSLTSSDNPQFNVHGRTIFQVVEAVKALGQANPAPMWGEALFCTRCDRNNHLRTHCFARDVFCTKCYNSGNGKRRGASQTHNTNRCLWG